MRPELRFVELEPAQVEQRVTELAALLTEALSASTTGALRSLAREITSTLVFAASPRAVTLLAETASGPAGLLVAVHEAEENRVFIHWVAVIPERRRAGIASGLVDQLEERHPMATIYGSVDQEDPAAVAFWSQRGWTRLRPPPRRVLMGRGPQAA
jgi:GNAT superfamily N-acetyltransferase